MAAIATSTVFLVLLKMLIPIPMPVMFCSYGNCNPSDIVIGVPACYLKYAQDKAPKGIKIAAENCYKVSSGAFTGEIR